MDMEKLLEKLEQKLDKLDGRLSDNTRVLERLTVTVEQHEQRSTSLEEDVKLRAKEFDLKLEQHSKDSTNILGPIRIHVNEVQGFFKILKWVLGIAAIVLGILKTIGVI